jgi:hypothetical protein
VERQPGPAHPDAATRTADRAAEPPLSCRPAVAPIWSDAESGTATLNLDLNSGADNASYGPGADPAEGTRCAL